MLSADEHHRASLYHSKRDTALFLAARILLRTSLSQYADVASDCWTFGVTSTGRPIITTPFYLHELHFNLSHTDGLIVCAISKNKEIGIDAENIRCRIISTAMAKKYLAPAEFKYVESLVSEQRQRVLLQYWTLKEAYAKARECGLDVPFSKLEFSLSNADGDCSAIFSNEVDEQPSSWFFREMKLSEDHVCSLAYLSQSPQNIRSHQF